MDIINRKNNVKTFESELYKLTSTIRNLIQEYEHKVTLKRLQIL